MLRLSPHYSNRPQDLVVQAGLIAVPPIGTAGNDGLPPQPSAVAVTVGVIVAIEERAAGEEEAVVEVVMAVRLRLNLVRQLTALRCNDAVTE
jgi:hypothetical protein